MEDDVMSFDSRCNMVQIYEEQQLCEVQKCGMSESTPKKVDKRPRENDDNSSEEEFTTVSRRKPKRHIRRDSNEKVQSFNGDSENVIGIHYEVSLFGLQILPKQMAFARFLREENILSVTNIKYKSLYKIFLQFSDKNQAEKLINSRKLVDMNIRAQFTNQGNLSYGIIKGVDLDTSEKELLGNLKCDYEIISAKRLNRMTQEGKWVESETVRLCFESPVAPSSIHAYGFKFDVERFEFPVTQCSKCWSFGHKKKFCKVNKSICPKCCCNDHENCEIQEFKCINCKGPHMAIDKTCPFFKKEKEIRVLMSEHNITYKTGLEMYLNNKKEKKANNITEQVNIDLDTTYTTQVPINTMEKTYSSVLKTTAVIHENKNKDEQSDKKNINQKKNRDKKKKEKVDNIQTIRSESHNDIIDYDNSDESEKENPTEKENRKSQWKFDIWNLLNRIKEILLSKENWCDKLMLAVKVLFEECKLFLVNFLNEGKFYDIFAKIIFNG